MTSYKPTAIRCGLNSVDPTGINGTSWITAISEYFPSAILISGRKVFTPAVCNQVLVQAVKSRPEVASNSTIKSVSTVLPQACFAKYFLKPAKKLSLPTCATSCCNTEAPFAYAIPSKLVRTSSIFFISTAIGWVEESWSWRYAQFFRAPVNSVQELVYLVALEDV